MPLPNQEAATVTRPFWQTFQLVSNVTRKAMLLPLNELLPVSDYLFLKYI